MKYDEELKKNVRMGLEYYGTFSSSDKKFWTPW